MTREFVEAVTPVWSSDELDEILSPTGNVIHGDQKIQRDALMAEISESSEAPAADIRAVVSGALNWDNYREALVL